MTSSLFESTAYLVAQHMAQYELTGEAPPPMSVKRPAWGVYDIFETGGGGRLFIGVVTDTQWEVFCREFGETELAADPRLKTNGVRVKERGWLIPRIAEITKKHTPGRARRQARGNGPAVRADREALGPARRSAPQRVRRLDADQGAAARRSQVPALPLALDGKRLAQALRSAGASASTDGNCWPSSAVHPRKSKACATGV